MQARVHSEKTMNSAEYLLPFFTRVTTILPSCSWTIIPIPALGLSAKAWPEVAGEIPAGETPAAGDNAGGVGGAPFVAAEHCVKHPCSSVSRTLVSSPSSFSCDKMSGGRNGGPFSAADKAPQTSCSLCFFGSSCRVRLSGHRFGVLIIRAAQDLYPTGFPELEPLWLQSAGLWSHFTEPLCMGS